ncbi:nucleotidyl transferase AbiEii/AbiGii toxin family protein [Caldicellulosiruptor morganii]|uniref:Nucleotidyl transferase AbiEii/AbiGii toxin family protein n=2 Tax=Caldicellulosiruptor morganii TaxID=1387555 RepID=A0ABY7BP88_9FIRM|nr:nucleotidyl transferase AbiEii/AbiGii toxin family protein [Caldicellulosiruptor morganii]WAM34243.1 nucleotidyl transferase AbiEii/AbiGii toxin family protein [Caldicellulosiruptor morganii]
MITEEKTKKEPVLMDMEVLDPEGYEICRNIAKSNLAKKFYLAGGTALALQLCHRKLYDLDFFQKEVSKKLKSI